MKNKTRKKIRKRTSVKTRKYVYKYESMKEVEFLKEGSSGMFAGAIAKEKINSHTFVRNKKKVVGIALNDAKPGQTVYVAINATMIIKCD